MKVVDANVLVYAVNGRAEHHEASRRWLELALAGGDRVGFSWLVLVAFLRITTSPAVFDRPMETRDAVSQLEAWLDSQSAVVLHPRPTHLTELGRLLAETGSLGNLVNDAHLAVLALECRGAVVSYDRDFARFSGVRSHRPDDLLLG